MSWIKPLEMKTWIINVLTGGDLNIFTAIAIMVISGMAGYFRMNGITLFLMLGLFFMIFMGYIPFEIYFIFLAVASILIGVAISKVVKN